MDLSKLDGTQNSSGAYPNIIETDAGLFYINAASKTEDGNNLYRLDPDGRNRTAILTLEQATRLYKKIRKDAIVLQPQNLLHARKGRLYFICQTRELVKGSGSEEFHGEYIFSVDYHGKDLKMVKELVKPGDRVEFSDWRIANYENFASYMKVRGYRLPILEGGWDFFLEDGKIVKQKPGSSERIVVFSDFPVDRFTVYKGWIYFERFHAVDIHRVSVNGEGFQVIGSATNSDHGFAGFTILDGWIYYLNNDDDTMEFSLHRMKTDGTEDTEIKTDAHPYSFQIINGRIFYNTIKISKALDNGSVMYGNQWNLRVMNLDGTGDRVID